MKNTRAIVMIGVSCVAAIAAVVLASRWINEQAAISTQKVVVAANEINVGTPLTAGMLKVADWPANSVPEGSFTDTAALDTRVTRVVLQRGEPLLESKLAVRGSTGGLSAVVAEGKRAMTVRVNDVVGVAGFALPGNFVDILVSTQEEAKKPDGRDLSISKLVLERILVLAVAQEANPNDTKPKVVNAVTLEVTPEQAEKLDLARSVGQLSLVLRNQVDSRPTETQGATKDSLLGTTDVHGREKEKQAEEAKRAAEAKSAARKASRVPRNDAGERIATNCQHVFTGGGRITQCY